MPPKTARYQYNYEVEDRQEARVNKRKIPGGSKDEIAPNPKQVKMNAGFKVADGRGNIVETEQALKPLRMDGTGKKEKKLPNNYKEPMDKKDPQLVKPIVGNGIFGSLGDIIDSVVGGNTKMPPMTSKIPERATKGGNILGDVLEAAPLLALGKEGAGIFSDIGNVIDTVVDAAGKAPKYVQSQNKEMKRGKGKTEKERQDDVDNLRKRVVELTAGFKDIQKLVKKLK